MRQQPLFCQRWREHRESYRPAGEPIKTSEYEVAPITVAEAKRFVMEHHYSGSYPACRFRFGLFTNYSLVGVAVFSVPMAARVLTSVFPGDPLESVELGRFVLLDKVPANGETWFQARCRELLKREGLRGVVAFSDDVPRTRADGSVVFPGHVGTIYQASNAVFLGRGAPGTQWVFEDGTVLSRRAISKIRNRESGFEYACQILVRHGAEEPGSDLREWLEVSMSTLTRKVRHPGALKYAWSLTRKIQLPESKPYHKK